MGIKSIILLPYAAYIHSKVKKDAKNAVEDQKKWFHHLISNATRTQFGIDHSYDKIKSYNEFVQEVPIRDYEALKSYIDLILDGQENILWKGVPKYLAKTSGTTSGIKYIPISKESIPYHISTARNAVMNHSYLAKNMSLFDGYLMFLSGSPILSKTNQIPTGRLSGIVNHEIPFWLKKSQKPSYEINCIEEWESKLSQIVKETSALNMTSISGIPPWVQMYFEQLEVATNQKGVQNIFPNFSLFVYGGVNYEPYRNAIESLMGKSVYSLETYPASEGFIAFQDQIENEGLLLNTNAGIFYEFVPLSEIYNTNPDRLSLLEVELNKDYAVILSSNAGLWAYNIGDTIRFVSRDPYRIVVTGRIKHFISAFGEHVISKEVETAMSLAMKEYNISITEFTVAPQVNPKEGQAPYHEWFIEFNGQISKNMFGMSRTLDESIQDQNVYYKDLREGNILQELKITTLRSDAFRHYMESIGKLGGQNKVPRLSNDRNIAEKLEEFKNSY